MSPRKYTKEKRRKRPAASGILKWNRRIGRLAGLFFPPRCPLCGEILPETESYAHAACLAGTVYAKGAQEPADRMIVWVYTGAVRQALYGLKYKNKREYATLFAREALRVYGSRLTGLGIEAVIPVPLHKKRMRMRGYNQAACIARLVAAGLCVPCREDLLHRVRHTAPLKSKSAGERMHSLRGAFAAEKEAGELTCVLLVDDIYTTGSTFDEAKRALETAGVRQVFCLAAAGGQTSEK